MQSDINDLFRNGGGLPSLFDDDNALLGAEWSPRIDIREDDKEYFVTADVPGVDPKDIEVTMTNGLLTIRGERKTEKEEKKDNYRRRECFMGSFERSFRMPDTADSDKITAKGKHGVLNIHIAKKNGVKPKTIKIETEK